MGLLLAAVPGLVSVAPEIAPSVSRVRRRVRRALHPERRPPAYAPRHADALPRRTREPNRPPWQTAAQPALTEAGRLSERMLP